MKRMMAWLCVLLMLLPCALAEEAEGNPTKSENPTKSAESAESESLTSAESALRGYQKGDGYVYVTLGQCPQDEDGGIEPILWRVLSVEDGKAYLLSEYVLEARPIHSDYQEYANKPTNSKKPGFDGDFTKTEMSIYLCGAFAESSFTEAERAMLTPHEEFGLFFLASSADLKNKAYGFTDNESRKAWGTAYALANGLFKYGSQRGGHSPYWTRTQSTTDARHACCTKSKGELGRINVITLDEGMRPACLLNVGSAVISGGSGTKDDPYTLAPAED